MGAPAHRSLLHPETPCDHQRECGTPPPDPCCFSRACTGRLHVREPSLSWALLAGFGNRQVSQGEEGIPSSAWEGTSRLLVKPV